jgi:hypothetical protein
MAAEIAAVSAAIAAASAGVDLIDKIYWQVKHVVTGRKQPTDTPYAQTIVREGDTLVSTASGQRQTITGADILKLPPRQLALVQTYEKAMATKVSLWESVYPTLELESGVAKAKVELQLKGIIASMDRDLNGILDFLHSVGLNLDDHYEDIRHLVKREAGEA